MREKESNELLDAVNRDEEKIITESFAKANGDITLDKSLLAAKVDPNQLVAEDLIRQERNLETEKHLKEIDEALEKESEHSKCFRSTMEIKKEEAPLLIASKKRNQEMLQTLLGAKANPNVADNQGVTALIEAASAGSDGCVHTLLEAKADFEQADKEGKTPLMAASIEGHHSIVQRLLEVNANVNWSNLKGNTALIEAVSNFHETDVNDLRESGYSSLFDKNRKTVIALLLAAKADPLIRGKRASDFARNPEIKEILQKEEDILEKQGRELFEAAKNGKSALVQTLLATKANPNFTGENGTALIEACRMKDCRQQLGDEYKACKIMRYSRETFYRYQEAVEQGGVDECNDSVSAAEVKVKKEQQTVIVKSLLDAKADPNYKFDYEKNYFDHTSNKAKMVPASTTAFELAFENGDGEPIVLQHLLASKASPDKEHHLRRAAQNGYDSIVKLLLEAGASPSQREAGEAGKTARELANKPFVQQILYKAEIKERKTIMTMFFSKALMINRVTASGLAKKVVDYELGTVEEESPTPKVV